MRLKFVWIFVYLFILQSVEAQLTFHGDNTRSGVFDSPPIRTLHGVKWKFKTDAPVIGSPAISNGVVFVGSVDTFFYAIDQATGRLKWKFETNGSIQSSPAISDGLIYFATYEGLIYAVDENTGTLKWKFAMEYEKRFEATHLHGQGPKKQTIPDDWDFYLSSPAVFNNRVYVGSGDKNIYALNAKTGILEWKFATKDVVHGSPAIANNTVYIGSWDSHLYALDAVTGKEKWRFKAGEDFEKFNQVGFQGSPTVVDGTVYIGCRDSHVYAIEAATGRKKWDFPTGNSWVSNTPAVANGVVYAGTSPLNAIDAATGKLLYSYADEFGVFASPAIAGDMAYFSGMMGTLIAIHAKTGKLAWKFRTDGLNHDPLKLVGADGKFSKSAFAPMFNDFQDGYVTMYKRFTIGWILSSPVVSNGEIYFGSTDGFLYALK